MTYIHQLKSWPKFTWKTEQLLVMLGKVRQLEGKLAGRMEDLGFNLKDEALLQTLSAEVIKSSEIEGEVLDKEQVRSSLARKLGIQTFGIIPSDRNVDGVVELILDATKNHRKKLTRDRLFNWHSSLFPFGKSGHSSIKTGDWRDDSEGPMQVVSGAMGREIIHFRAPAAKKLEKEMTLFLNWFEEKDSTDPVLKAALAHLWFLTIHPFDDGNGRIARAIADLQLTRSDGNFPRFYSMSAQIRKERNKYYELLEKTQRGDLDITEWMQWFLNCLYSAMQASEKIIAVTLSKSRFWNQHKATSLNDRQHLIVNRLLDGFEGKLNSSKWGKICKCSTDTALRDIQDLVTKKMLMKDEGGGRSTSYSLNLNSNSDMQIALIPVGEHRKASI